MWLLLFLAFLLWLKKTSAMLYFDTLLFLIIGLLGAVMLFMWFGTDHQACGWNRNLFWALPSHILFAFFMPMRHKFVQPYARIAFYILLISLVFNLWAAQQFITELTPIILLLIWRLNHYKRDPEKTNFYANFRTIFSQIRTR